MSDRLKGVLVIFDDDMREDDAKPIIDAILCLRGVSTVHTKKVTAHDFMERVKIKHEIAEKLYEVLKV